MGLFVQDAVTAAGPGETAAVGGWLHERGMAAPASKPRRMELASLILRRSLGSVEHDGPRCSRCRRTPVPGELTHVFASDTVLCSLCLAKLPEAERSPLRSERVHVYGQRLAVAPKAA